MHHFWPLHCNRDESWCQNLPLLNYSSYKRGFTIRTTRQPNPPPPNTHTPTPIQIARVPAFKGTNGILKASRYLRRWVEAARGKTIKTATSAAIARDCKYTGMYHLFAIRERRKSRKSTPQSMGWWWFAGDGIYLHNSLRGILFAWSLINLITVNHMESKMDENGWWLVGRSLAVVALPVSLSTIQFTAAQLPLRAWDAKCQIVWSEWRA